MTHDFNQSSQLYKITFKPDGRYYIGITWGTKKSYLRRFRKHMKGKGSVHIKNLLLQGYTEEDFTVEVICEGPLYLTHPLESELSVLYPLGLNGNKGNAIVQSEDGFKKASQKREDKRYQTSIKIAQTLAPDKSLDSIISGIEKRKWWRSLSKIQKSEYILDNYLTKSEYKMSSDILDEWRQYTYEDKVKLKETLLSKVYMSKGLTKEESIDKFKNYRLNITQEENNRISELQSISLKLYISNLTDDEKRERLEKSLWNLSEEKKILRGKKISESKKGKSTNQLEITKQKYKNMSDNEFERWCEGRCKSAITKATNQRNGE